jgi:hypothetical protein
MAQSPQSPPILLQTPFWYENPSILYQSESLTEIFPSRRFDMTRKLNALVRLAFCYGVLMYLYEKERKYLYLPVVVLGITWIVHYKQKDSGKAQVMKDSINGQLADLTKLNALETECRIPTKDNPFMNPTLREYGSDQPTPPKSCPSYNNVGVQKRVEDLFNEDLYRDVTDVFGKNNSQRQYYTVPGSQIPNDQGSFSQWLYGTPPTCKEGNRTACLAQTGRGSSNGGGGT